MQYLVALGQRGQQELIAYTIQKAVDKPRSVP